MQTTTKDKPESGAPGPAALPEARRSTELALVAQVLQRATDQERSFIRELCEKNLQSVYTLQQDAFNLAAAAVGLPWIKDPWQLKDEFNHLREAYLVFMRGSNWQQKFLINCLMHFSGGALRNPEDALWIVEEELEEFRNRVEFAQNLLREHPEAIQEEIRAAVKKHPELTA